MSKLPKLAIVGRPNVGKSALFNRICKRNIAIVDEAEGITRDRLYAKADLFGLPFEVIDTGGINAHSKALFNEEIKRQAEIAIEEADILIMVVDSTTGVTLLDIEIARILMKTKKPIALAVNKVDEFSKEHLMYQFQQLGISPMVAVSATQSWHIAELLEAAFTGFDPTGLVGPADNTIKISIVGRPNVGKSSLVNYLLDDERCIVSTIPGTTRDSIDIPFSLDGTDYTLIDTAGIRRKHAEHEVVDKFAAIRTERAIERADICLLMLDAQQGMTAQEKKIANDIEAAGKGCILLFNKWDLVKGFRMEHCLKGIEDEINFLKHCPKLFMSAKTGRNVDRIFEIVNKVHADSQMRITTHQLNKFIADAMQRNHPPMLKGRRLRIYYMAQVAVQPPKFILFVNSPLLMAESYKKYIYNQFREVYGFTGVPIIIQMKGKLKQKNEKERHHEQDPGLEGPARRDPRDAKKVVEDTNEIFDEDGDEYDDHEGEDEFADLAFSEEEDE
ncbi:MAG: ribosome biogenesis GTPase Der [Parachlamydiaceae bacterium]|nr:ribosome biogenesis GTPase Der [Parachlamydiaceae bacterium]